MSTFWSHLVYYSAGVIALALVSVGLIYILQSHQRERKYAEMLVQLLQSSIGVYFGGKTDRILTAWLEAIKTVDDNQLTKDEACENVIRFIGAYMLKQGEPLSKEEESHVRTCVAKLNLDNKQSKQILMQALSIKDN